MKEQTIAVQRMQDYIGENLTREITLSDLARTSFFSPWYSYRLFREHLGLTPAEYIRRLRLSRAALRLRDENCRILDVAFDLGFGNVDTFTRDFFREFGLNPSDYAKAPVPIPLFIPYGAKFRELRKESTDMSDLRTVFVQMIHKPERLCIIKRGVHVEDYFPYCEEVSCDVWGILMETDYAGTVPEGFDIIRLPEADYLMFQGEPFREEDYCEAIRAVQQAMDRYTPTVIGYQWDDGNPRIQLEPRGERGYIELRAVKKL